jgi:heme A synthase
MRIFLQIAIPLLLPALLYWLYLSIQEKRGQPVREVPISWLAAAGVVLVAIGLVVGWFADSEKPGGKYVPPSVVDGKVVPGHFE